MIKIAMIEDDVELAGVLKEYLAKFDIQVTNYEDPYLGLSALGFEKYELVILDLSLPGLDGLEVCKEIVQKYAIPIIISSARSDITDKVTALSLGADDYLPKPYNPRELEARIKTILRRVKQTQVNMPKQKLFVLDEEKKQIKKNDNILSLTAGEYEVLSLFLRRDGFIVSREDVFENSKLLNSDYDSFGSLAVLINRIRAKIEEDAKKPKYLQTVRGMGYRFNNE